MAAVPDVEQDKRPRTEREVIVIDVLNEMGCEIQTLHDLGALVEIWKAVLAEKRVREGR